MNAQPQFITTSDGTKTAVILTLDDHEELLEDLQDLAAIAERKDESTLPFVGVLKDMGL